MSLAPGVRLGAYEIVSPLGAGGMGEVYLAHDPRLRREVAIKVLPPAFANDADRLQRFEREARAVAALTHPNILSIYDIGRHDDTPYIVMEYVRGETLTEYLRRERPSCTRALEIGAEIADALAAAHGRRLVHRDLKPGNVMMTPDGHVKVLDFGLAKTVADTVTSTRTQSSLNTAGTIVGQVLGTPGYMSPEQMLGETVDHLSDIYSLGVILFELVTGQRLFRNVHWDALWQATMAEPIRSAREADPSVPAAVSDLIARATSKDRAARPQSASALKAEIEQLLGSPAPRRARYAVAALVAALALGAAAVPLWRPSAPASVSPAERPVIAVLPLANLTGDDSKAFLGVGIADALTTSLGRLSSVSVVSRSTLQESGARTTTDVAAIARELGATLLVQGSVQQSGDRLRVNANLVTPDGKVQWSGDSEAGVADLFLLESRLAGSLIDALRIAVTETERQQLARPPTTDRAALEAYWQAMTLLEQPRTDIAGFDRAIAGLERAIALDGRFSLAHAGLGEAFRRKSLVTNDPLLMRRAVEEVSQALQLDPAQPEVRLSLARVYRATGRNGAAVEELRRALEDQPSNDDAHRLLGDLLASEGKPDEALEELRRAVALRPQYWRNHQSLGVFYLRTGRADEAVAALTRLTELNPDEASPYQQLGAAYQTLGDRVRARQNYERSIGISPNPGAYTNLGTIHYSEKRYEEAAQAYEHAVRLAPNNAIFRRNLGDAYLKIGRQGDARAAYEKAVQFAEEALAINPSNATTMSQLGVYEAKIGRHREAERHADGAAAINPSSPEVLYRRAVVLALGRKTDAALTRLSEAIASGYSRQLALEDDDLATLRSLPAFQALVSPAQ